MLMRIPEKSLEDSILEAAGKRRAIIMTAKAHQEFGPCVSLLPIKEPLPKALQIPKDQEAHGGHFIRLPSFFSEGNDNA